MHSSQRAAASIRAAAGRMPDPPTGEHAQGELDLTTPPPDSGREAAP